MTNPLWAPWRLEYVEHVDEPPGLHLLRAGARGGESHAATHAFVLLNRFPYSSGHLMSRPTATSAPTES